MFNQVMLIGHLGRDPEQRFTNTGTAVTSFSIAVTEKWTGADGQRQEQTTWVKVTAWKKLAELSAQYLKKGSLCLVVGKLESPGAYIGKDGQAMASNEVTAREIKFLTPKGEQGADPRDPNAGPTQQQMIDDDSIPF